MPIPDQPRPSSSSRSSLRLVRTRNTIPARMKARTITIAPRRKTLSSIFDVASALAASALTFASADSSATLRELRRVNRGLGLDQARLGADEGHLGVLGDHAQAGGVLDRLVGLVVGGLGRRPRALEIPSIWA